MYVSFRCILTYYSCLTFHFHFEAKSDFLIFAIMRYLIKTKCFDGAFGDDIPAPSAAAAHSELIFA